jgi:glycine C-acetyltransferase
MDANCGLFEAVLGPDDVLIADRLVHASVVDGMRLSKAVQDTYKHSDMTHLEEKLREHAGRRRRMIVTDGVFSMDGDVAKLDRIVSLARRHDAMVCVDDSHATGVLGHTGRGSHEHHGVFGAVDVITTTLGKALGGASGGCVSGREEIVEMCRQRARPYLFSNSVAPVVVAGAIAALDLVAEPALGRLRENARHWRKALREAGFDVREGETPIVPVMLYDARLARSFAKDLVEEGIYVVGFSFPVVPKGQARVRTQVSAAHERWHLDHAIEAFVRVGARLGILGKDRKEIEAMCVS